MSGHTLKPTVVEQLNTFAEVITPGGTHEYPSCFGSIRELCDSGLKPIRSLTDCIIS